MEDGSPCGTVVDNTNEKPPLGLRPEVAWWNDRVKEIGKAVARYEKAGVAIPVEWLMEQNNLTSKISHTLC